MPHRYDDSSQKQSQKQFVDTERLDPVVQSTESDQQLKKDLIRPIKISTTSGKNHGVRGGTSEGNRRGGPKSIKRNIHRLTDDQQSSQLRDSKESK